MENEVYKIIYREGNALIEEKKSKFIARTKSVYTQEEALQYLEELKKEYWDARHYCYAYTLGERNEIVKCSDDGEPSQTAGKPILDILQKSQVHNAIIVVIRYFGGTLLGTGGLVKAYQAAAKEGLERSGIMQLLSGIKVTLTIEYTHLSKIQYILEQNRCFILNTDYSNEVALTLLIPEEKIEMVEASMKNQMAKDVSFQNKQKCFYGFDEDKVKIFEKKC